ncbi:MAG: hypothetical protein M1824_006213 [Vezdaea acicularis]|nr:MAG: hypothetical protein M1824_006213 [Vezdaea acicularis]
MPSTNGLTTSVELLSDGLATTGSAAATKTPTSNSSPPSSTTTVVLEPAATSDSSLSRHKKKKGVGIGGIVGIIVGVLALLGLIGVALVFFCFQRRKKRRGATAAAASAQQKYNPVPQQMENLPPQQHYQPPPQVPYSPPVATGVMYDDKTGFNAATTPLQRDTTGGSQQSYVQGPEVPLFPGSPSPQPSVPAGRHLSADSAMFTAVSPMTGHTGVSGELPFSPQVTGIAPSRGIAPQQTSSTGAPSLHASNNAGPVPEAYDHH